MRYSTTMVRRYLADILTEVAEGKGKPTHERPYPCLVFYVGPGVQDGGAVHHVQPPDADGRASNLEHPKDRHTDGVGPDG